MSIRLRKPRGTGIVASNRGWEKVWPNGNSELLVSRKNLLTFLASHGLDKFGEGVVEQPEAPVVEAPVVTEKAPVVKETTTPAVKKKRPSAPKKPKKPVSPKSDSSEE